MTTQTRSFNHSDLRTLLDMFLVAVGVFTGGLVALLTLWLWFDYQADPARSLLAMGITVVAGIIPDWLSSLIYAEVQTMGLPLTAGQTSAFWYMARSGGIVAYLLLWLSTVWGLTLSTKITDGLVPAPIAYGLHEFLSIGAVLFTVVHAVVLLGDEYIQFNLWHLTVPFIAPYEPLWTGLGVIGLYMTVILTGSFYVRKRIGQKLWRKMHYLAFAGYALALLHGLMAGTDSATDGFRLMYLGTGFIVLFLTYFRLFTLKVKNK